MNAQSPHLNTLNQEGPIYVTYKGVTTEIHEKELYIYVPKDKFSPQQLIDWEKAIKSRYKKIDKVNVSTIEEHIKDNL